MTRTWLPPELIELVMDHLHSDKRTLAACSVVCKAWIYPARSRLFANIFLNDTGLKKLLESGSAVIPFIRHLRIVCFESSFWNENISCLVGFESIRSLSLDYFRWKDIFPKTRSSLQTHFATIVCLRIYKFRAHSFSELAEVICSFRHLETLVIDRVRWDDLDMPSSSLCLSDNLRALELQNCEGGSILEWLLSLERTPALHTVYLHESDFDEVDRFLQALGTSLEVLLCGTCIDDGTFQVDRPVNLSYNTRLQVLHIKLYKLDGVVNIRQRVTQWATRILSQIVSEHMNRMVFEIVVENDDPPNLLEWSEVDSILALSQFSRLKNVDINLVEHYVEDLRERLELFDWFISRLPRCHARGILRIHLTEWKSRILTPHNIFDMRVEETSMSRVTLKSDINRFQGRMYFAPERCVQRISGTSEH